MELRVSRVHIALHIVPLAFLGSLLIDSSAGWILPGLVVLFVLFFVTGRKTWQVFGELFPQTPLYRIFYRGNSVFLFTIPLAFLASRLVPDVVGSDLTTRMAMIYFAGHFMMIGIAYLRIESDLRRDHA